MSAPYHPSDRVIAYPSSPRETPDARVHDKIRSVLKLKTKVAFVSAADLQEPQKRIPELRRWD